MYKCKVLAKLITCHYALRSENEFNNGICSICENYVANDLCHFLFECKTFEKIRQTEWKIVESKMPLGFKNSVNQMCDLEKTKFILNGLGGSYIQEFYDIYNTVLDFIMKMYDRKQNKV